MNLGIIASQALGSDSQSDPFWSYVGALLHLNGAVAEEANKIAMETYGSPSWSDSGLFGKALDLTGSGTNGIRSVAKSPSSVAFGTGDFTIEFAVKIPSGIPSGDMGIIDTFYLGGGVVSWQVGQSAGKLWFYKYTGVGAYPIKSDISLADGGWHQIAFTRASGTLRLFIDGILEKSVALSDNFVTTNAYFALGYQSRDNKYPFKGFIDEVRMTKGIARYVADYEPTGEPFPDS